MPLVFVLDKVRKISFLLFIMLLCLQINLSAQKADSVAVRQAGRKLKSDPYRATMLAAAFPGLGQIHNRKYWKLPFVYAGFGGLVYAVSFNTSKYNDYTAAYQDFNDKVAETDSYLELIPADPATYDPVLHPGTYTPSNESYWKDRMLNGLDYYKRYRDLSYIGIAAWYLVTILDANVDASLVNFDVSDNLQLAVAPVIVPLPGGYTGAGLNINMVVNF